MKRLKILFIFTVVTMLLVLGTPTMTNAAALEQMPPATVFVVDKNHRMLLNHNFNGDGSIFIPGKADGDPGFYVQIG